MKTVYEVWVMKVTGTLEPLLDEDEALAKEYDTQAKARSEAQNQASHDDVERAYVIERRVVEEFVAHEGDTKLTAPPAEKTYEVGALASDLSLHGNEDYVDVRCPCGGRTGFSRKAVRESGKDGMIGKCLRCSRHFKLGVEDNLIKIWNVSQVPVA